MAKKKPKAPRSRTDAERNTRQCERLAKVLRTFRCISGPGRWDVQALAEELECSPQTDQRILHTLSMAGVPFTYDAVARAYRVPSTFKFPVLTDRDVEVDETSIATKLLPRVKRAIVEGEEFVASLQELREAHEK